MCKKIRLSHSKKKAAKKAAIFITKTTINELIKHLIKFLFDLLVK